MDSTSQYLPLLKFTLLGAAALLFYELLNKNRKVQRLPPGPPCIPIIGNAHLIPKEKSWLAFDAWSKQYGIKFLYHSVSINLVSSNIFYSSKAELYAS